MRKKLYAIVSKKGKEISHLDIYETRDVDFDEETEEMWEIKIERVKQVEKVYVS